MHPESQAWANLVYHANNIVLLAATGTSGSGGDPVKASPNNTGIPGIPQMETILGGALTVGLIACVFGMVVGGATWAYSERSGNIVRGHNARNITLGALLGAVIVGAASVLVSAAYGIGVGF